MKEKELEDKLEKNLNKIEPGLSLVERQKRVDAGIIDLFCKDRDEKYVIIEIKRKPDIGVVAQLAKYNMVLVKSGLSKRKLRTILVAQDISKAVKEACEFFNFEIKIVYKEKISDKRYGLAGHNVPTKDELIKFINKKGFANLSMIAKEFDIPNVTASDIAHDLEKENLVKVIKLGSNKVVMPR